MAKDLSGILLNEAEELAIKENTPDNMPINPTAQGWTGNQVRRFLAKALINAEGSIISEFKKKMIEIKSQFEDIFGQGDGAIQQQITDLVDALVDGLELKVTKTGDDMTGALDMTGNNINNILQAVFYNSEGNAVAYFDGKDFILSYGGIIREYGKNLFAGIKAREIIANGSPLQYDGSAGSSGKIYVKNAVPAEININPHYLIGVSTTSLASGEEKDMNTYGAVNDIDTTNFNGGVGDSTDEGKEIFFDSINGGITLDKPIAPNVQISLGTLSIYHATQGQIKVSINTGRFLKDLHDVCFNGHVFVGGETIKFNFSTLRFEVFNLDGAFIDAVTVNDAKLLLKEDKSNKGIAGGYAGLNELGIVFSEQLPSYIDNIEEYATYADLPETGVQNRIYVVLEDETSYGNVSQYRWSGTVYTQISNTMSPAEIKALYESNANTNEFTDAEKAKVVNTPSDTVIELLGKMGKTDYASNGEEGVVDETVLARTAQQTIVVPLTKVTLGKFYATVAGFSLILHNQFTLLFPNSTTDLTENVEVSLGGVSGTYKYLKYDDTQNNVLVKHTNNAKATVYYDNTELMMKGEPLLPYEITFTELHSSTYGIIKPINGQAQMKEVNGLMLNQLILYGDFRASTGWSNLIQWAIAGDVASYDAVANGFMQTDMTIIAGYKYVVSLDISNGGGASRLLFTDGAGTTLFDETTVYLTLPNGKFAAVYTASVDATAVRVYSLTSGGTFDLDNLMFIPITNTPLHSHTAPQIDNMGITYFENTKWIVDYEMQSISVNLFDKDATDNVPDYYVSIINGNVLPLTGRYATGFITVIPDTDYYTAGSQAGGASIGRVFYDKNQNYISGVVTQGDATWHSPINAYCIRETLLMSTFELAQIQEGTVATAHKPYNSPTNFKLNEFNGKSVGTDIRDKAIQINGVWYKKPYVGYDYNDVVQSMTTWTIGGVQATTHFFSHNFGGLDIKRALSTLIPTINTIKIGNITFTNVSTNDMGTIDTENTFAVATTLDAIYLRVNKTTYPDSATLESDLLNGVGNDVEFTFELATPADLVELLQDGSIIQEANTTLIQVGNFATKIIVEFACNANALLDILNKKIIKIQTGQDNIEEDIEDMNVGEQEDLTFPANQSVQGNTQKPDYDFTNVGLLFPQDVAEIVTMGKEFPHRYKAGSDVDIHIHLIQTEDAQIEFTVQYRWYNGGAEVPSWTTVVLETYAFAYVSGSLHQILYIPDIDGTGKEESSWFEMKVYRSDTAHTAEVLVKEFSVHYLVDKFGKNIL